jgi:uncharacterized protein
MESYIETVSGRKFYFLNPDPDDIDIGDIAHALAMNCRYTGHCDRFYSVAEHSFHMSRMAPEGYELAALLHDASEAYITDIASPIKQHLPDYQAMEDSLMRAIASKFGFEYPLNPVIKHLDLTMLSTEAHYMIPSRGDTWDLWKYRKRPTIQWNFRPIGMTPKVAKSVFLERYDELKEKYGVCATNRGASSD